MKKEYYSNGRKKYLTRRGHEVFAARQRRGRREPHRPALRRGRAPLRGGRDREPAHGRGDRGRAQGRN